MIYNKRQLKIFKDVKNREWHRQNRLREPFIRQFTSRLKNYFNNLGNELREDFQDFDTSIESNFMSILNITEDIYQNTIKEPGWIDLEYLSNYPFKIGLKRFDPITFIYSIDDTDDLIYRFAMRYSR